MTSQTSRHRSAPARSTRVARTAIAALAVAALLAACGRTVAGTLEGGPAPTAPTGSSSAPQTSGSGTSTPTGSTAATSPATTGSTAGTGSTDSTDSTETTDSTDSTEGTDSTESTGTTGSTAYPTSPVPYAKTPNTEAIGAQLEGRRLAGYSVDPAQVDPAYDRVNNPTMPLYGPRALSLTFEQPTITAADRGGMYSGYVAAKGSSGNGGLVIAALVYPDATKAKAAVSALAATVKGKADVPVELTGVPGAKGWRGVVGGSQYSAQAFVASGSVVAYAYVSGRTAQRATMLGTLQKAMIMQADALTRYQPVAKDQLTAQPYDPTGLFSRTLPATGDDRGFSDGVFAAQGALHTQQNYALSSKNFKAAGVDIVSISKAVVYRAKDGSGASALRDAFYAEQVADDAAWRDYDPGTEQGNARCLENATQARYLCFGAQDRYTIELTSTSEQDMKAQLEAQVALLGS